MKISDLEAAVEFDRGDTKSLFNLALAHDAMQASLAGTLQFRAAELHRKEAIRRYEERAFTSGDEAYYSLYRVGMLTLNPNDRFGIFLRAWAASPFRWEAAYELCMLLHGRGYSEAAYAISRKCVEDETTEGFRFDKPIHEYAMFGCHASGCLKCGFFMEAIHWSDVTLSAEIPEDIRRQAVALKSAAIESLPPEEAVEYFDKLIDNRDTAPEAKAAAIRCRANALAKLGKWSTTC